LKKALRIAAIVVLATAVAACGKLNSRIDETIESVGTDLTGVPVDVQKVKVKFGAVSGEITGLSVANPDGYLTVNAFDLHQLRLNVGLFKTLTGPSIALDELLIDSPVLILEFNAEGGTNIGEIAQNVRKNIESTNSGQEPRTSGTEEDVEAEKESPRIFVKKLVIEGVTFYVRRSDGTFRSGTLPAIELTDVGGDEGKTPAGLGAVVVLAMAGEILKQAVAHKLADGFRFEAEKLLVYLEQRLSLTAEQLAEMRPVAVTIADSLNNTLETWAVEGFVDFESLSRDLAPLAAEARSALKQVLDSDQWEAFDAFLASLNEEALEAIRNSLVERLAATLELREDQTEKLKPVLRQHVEKLGALLSGVVSGSGTSFEAFAAEYAELRSETRGKLKDVLDADQLRILMVRLDEIRQRIRSLLF